MIKNKNVLITGGLGFIGSFFSKLLIENEYNLIIIDKKNPKTHTQKKILKKSIFFKSDISSENEILKIYKYLKINNIKINYLINNAAIDSIPKFSKKNSHLPNKEDWNKELDVGLTGSYLLIKYFGEDMKKRKKGKIVNIGSDLSVIAPNQDIYSDFDNFLKPVTYSVIKHGLLGMTKYFASLYAKENIQVNMLSPGPVYNKQNKKFQKKLISLIPAKKIANKEDLSQTLLFLLNDKNNYLTGQNIIIDGGRTII